MVRYDKRTAERGAKYVEDRRRSGGGRGAGGISGGKAIGGIGGLILLLVGSFLGINLTSGSDYGLESQSGFDGSAGAVNVDQDIEFVDADADTKEYMAFLMVDIQDTWDEYFDQAGLTYQPTKLVIFQDQVSSGCGTATAAVGPFYCPAPNDMKVYIDFSFYDELSQRFGAPGDFAQAYVIAHEVGHHIQSITGISGAVQEAKQQDPGNANEYSIRQELQADCLAGVWAFSASQRLTEDSGQPIIERGDIDEGLQAAASVGDDRIQAQSGMSINPHTWTHGSADQRVRWFKVGFDNGDPEMCDTFESSDV